jgi:hypothetical protein
MGSILTDYSSFLYALFLVINTNFRLMGKDVFFGEVTKYMAHLEKHWDQKQEVSMTGLWSNWNLTPFFGREVLVSPTTLSTSLFRSSWGRRHRELGRSTVPATT